MHTTANTTTTPQVLSKLLSRLLSGFVFLSLLVSEVLVSAPPTHAQQPAVKVDTIRAFNAVFRDRGDSVYYTPNAERAWLLLPEIRQSPTGRADTAKQIRFWFAAFSTEPDQDFVRIYDGRNANAPLLAEVSGFGIDQSSSVVSSGGALFIQFITNSFRDVETDFGWTARFVSSTQATVLETDVELLEFETTTFGKRSDVLDFVVSGTNLTEGLIITAPEGFLVAADSNGVFRDSLLVPKPDGVSSLRQQVFVRFAPNSVATFNDRISIYSNTALIHVDVSGQAPPAIYWEPSIGPYTARVAALALAPGNTLLAGGLAGGIFRSNSNGDAWLASSTGLDSAGSTLISDMFVSNGRAFAVTAAGVYASDNSGAAWKPLTDGLPADADERAMSFITGLGDTLFVSDGEQIFVSQNRGERWQPFAIANTPAGDSARFTKNFISALAYNGSTLTIATDDDEESSGSYAIWHGKFVQSPNSSNPASGANPPAFALKPDDSYAGDYYVTKFVAHNGSLYAGTYDGFVFKGTLSNDSSAGWKSLADGANIGSGAGKAASMRVLSMASGGTGTGNLLTVGTENGVFRSSDDGATWQNTTTTRGLTEPDVTALLANGVEMYAGTNAGMFRSRNRGSAWTGSSAGLSAAVTTALKEHRGVMLAGTAGSGVFRSTDNGSSWTPANAGLRGRFIGAFSSVGSTVYAVAYDPYSPANPASALPGIYRSQDNGTSWTLVYADTLTISTLATQTGTVLKSERSFRSINTLHTVGRSFFAGGSAMEEVDTTRGSGTASRTVDRNVVLRSTDGGARWIRTAFPSDSASEITSFTRGSGTTVFAGTSDDGVYRSNNDGITWEADGNFRKVVTITGDKTVNTMLTSGFTIFAATDGGLFRSFNNGTSWAWIPFDENDEGTSVLSITIAQGIVYAATIGSGVWRSLDGGTTWEPSNEGLGRNRNIFSLAAAGSAESGVTDLYAGLGGGVVFRSALQLPSTTPRVFLSISQTLEAAPGDSVRIAVVLDSLQLPRSLTNPITVTGTLRYNASLLDPGEALRVEAVVSGERLIPVGFTVNPRAGTEQRAFTFRAMLGNSVATPLRLTNLSADSAVVLALRPGLFSLKGLSQEGGVRLFSSERQPTILASLPNPSDDILTVRYELTESGTTVLSLVNVFGQQMKTVSTMNAVPGIYDASITTADVPPGAYFLTLRTPTMRVVRQVTVVR
jgi:photosystem II stability/assembly factor-like uncharacterized protein